MFLFASTKNIAPPAQRMMNLAPDRLPTNEAARPLPYYAGRAVLGLTWGSEAINPVATPITAKVQTGMKSSETRTVGYTYKCSCIGLVAPLPSNALRRIWLDEVVAWEGPLTRPGDGQPSSLDIPNQAAIRVQWGTQHTVDSVLTGHPAYTGITGLVFDPLVLGRDRTAAQPIKAEWERATVVPGLSNPTDEGDVCLLHALIEALCHPRCGAGLRLSEFNLDDIQTVSDELTAAGIWGSPVFTEPMSALALAAELLGYLDGFIRLGADGRYSVRSTSLEANFDSAPALTKGNLTALAEPVSPSYALTPRNTRVVYTNRDADFKEDVAVWADTGGGELHGTSQPVTLQRRAITRPALASAFAVRAGLRAALPPGRISARGLLSACASLLPGDPVRVEPWPDAGYYLNCRLTRKTQGKSTDRELALELAVDPSSLVTGPASDGYTPPAAGTSDPADLVSPLLRTLPTTLAAAGEGDKAVALLGARSHGLHTGYTVHFSRDDITYEALETINRFAGTGTLTSAFNAVGTFTASAATDKITINAHGLANGTPLAFAIGGGVLPAPLVEGKTYYVVSTATNDFKLALTVGGSAIDLTTAGTTNATRKCLRVSTQLDMHAVDRLNFAGQNSDQADDNTLLLFLESEILSVEGYTAAGGTLMDVANLRRGRYGTTPADHANGARGWLIYRADLVALTHVAFTTGATRYFKPVTFTATASQDIADITAESVVI